MKKYIEPEIDIQDIDTKEFIIATSGDEPSIINEEGDEGNYSKRIDFAEFESLF